MTFALDNLKHGQPNPGNELINQDLQQNFINIYHVHMSNGLWSFVTHILKMGGLRVGTAKNRPGCSGSYGPPRSTSAVLPVSWFFGWIWHKGHWEVLWKCIVSCIMISIQGESKKNNPHNIFAKGWEFLSKIFQAQCLVKSTQNHLISLALVKSWKVAPF